MMRERWRIVIHRKRGMFRFVLRDGYLGRWEAEQAKKRIWRQHKIRWLKVESYHEPLKGGQMRKKSEHYSDRHEAVAAVPCPVCQQPKGVPCVVAETGRRREQHGNETHVGRVRKFERDALPGEPGSVLPPSPVDTDNDCAP